MSTQKICLGVETCPNGLKIALVNLKHRKIIKVDAVPTSGNPVNDTSVYASAIGSWVRSKIIPKIELVAIAVPASSCVTRAISIPKETENLGSYIGWEFASAINTKPGDYKLDTFFFPNTKKAERAVISAYRKELVNSFCSSDMEKSGFMPSSIMTELCCLFNLLEYTEGLGSAVKCVLKIDEKFAIAFWANEYGPLAFRILPGDCISEESVLGMLESGFGDFPKAKRVVKFCGELTEDSHFAMELMASAKKAKNAMNISIWNSVNKFSLEKSGEFSKLPQCLVAVGATLNCL